MRIRYIQRMEISSTPNIHTAPKVRKTIVARVKDSSVGRVDSEDVSDHDSTTERDVMGDAQMLRRKYQPNNSHFKGIRNIFSPFGADNDIVVVGYVLYEFASRVSIFNFNILSPLLIAELGDQVSLCISTYPFFLSHSVFMCQCMLIFFSLLSLFVSHKQDTSRKSIPVLMYSHVLSPLEKAFPGNKGKIIWGYVTATAAILTVLVYLSLTPVIEYGNMKRETLVGCSLLCSILHIMYIFCFFKGALYLAVPLMILAKITQRVSDVAFNALLDVVAHGKDPHQISSRCNITGMTSTSV